MTPTIFNDPEFQKQHAQFKAFLDDVLANPVAKAAFEDSRIRNAAVDQLQAARVATGLSAREVARRMGVADGTVRRLEQEGSDPTVSLVQRYARAVGMQATINLAAMEDM